MSKYEMHKGAYELDLQDGIWWCRPIDAPADCPWRPVDGETGQYAHSRAEAARVLRADGFRVTRRRSGY
jgi:hypothetical protein